MKRDSLAGLAFIAILSGVNGFSINNPNLNNGRRKTINKVNDYIEKLHPELNKSFAGIEEYHHGLLSENDALMGTPLEGSPQNIIDDFKKDIQAMSKEERDVAFGYLGAIDLRQKKGVPDDVKEEAAEFVKKCPFQHNDIGQVESKLRPKEVKEKIPLTPRVMMHGAVALLLFEARKLVDPNASRKVEGHFNETKYKISRSLGHDEEITPCQYWREMVRNETDNKEVLHP